MSRTVPTPSLEPYLRARSIDPRMVRTPPRAMPWSERPRPRTRANVDFVDFLENLLKLLIAPVVIPLNLMHKAVTSPLTISLVVRLILLGALTLASAVFSVLAVSAWWYSWGTGGPVEVEGWLFYGSKSHRTPHVLMPLPQTQFQEDLRYDVQVEMELVRPARGSEEIMGNFMLSLQLRSLRDQELVVIGAAQPSLPPPALHTGLIPLPSLSTYLIPPCIIPWPFRSLCPSRILGYDKRSASKLRERRAKGGFGSPARGNDVVLVKKELMEGVILNPARGGDATVGYAFVSIGREDAFAEDSDIARERNHREVKTTGWVVIRFIPLPTGIRWLLSVHPLPPLLLLPPLSLTLTMSSSLFAFVIINYLVKPRPLKKTIKSATEDLTTEEQLLEEKKRSTFDARDREERREERRRRDEWEEAESSALGGLRRIPAGVKRGTTVASSTIGGSETTRRSSGLRSFGGESDSGDGDDSASSSSNATSETTGSEDTILAESTGLRLRGGRGSEESGGHSDGSGSGSGSDEWVRA